MATPRSLQGHPLMSRYVIPIRELIFHFGDRDGLYLEVTLAFSRTKRKAATFHFEPHTGRIRAAMLIAGKVHQRQITDAEFVTHQCVCDGSAKFTIQVHVLDRSRSGSRLSSASIRERINRHPVYHCLRKDGRWRTHRVPVIIPPATIYALAKPAAYVGWCPQPRPTTGTMEDALDADHNRVIDTMVEGHDKQESTMASTRLLQHLHGERPAGVVWLYGMLVEGSHLSSWLGWKCPRLELPTLPEDAMSGYVICCLQRNAMAMYKWLEDGPSPYRLSPPPMLNGCCCTCPSEPREAGVWRHADVIADWPLVCAVLAQPDVNDVSETTLQVWWAAMAVEVLVRVFPTLEFDPHAPMTSNDQGRGGPYHFQELPRGLFHWLQSLCRRG